MEINREQMLKDYKELIVKYGGGHILFEEIDSLKKDVEDRDQQIIDLLKERSRLRSEVLSLKMKLDAMNKGWNTGGHFGLDVNI